MAQALLVVNLGCELVYVVEQRLRAQRLPRHTADTVLTDILEVLFNEKFIQELEDAPQLGRQNHVRQLMEDIANVSIMRLDTFSMSKLWELMIMVLKWQISVAKEDELFLLTERHLQGVKQLVANRSISSKIIAYHQKIYKLGKETNCKCAIMMRNAISDWLKDFNVRVSLLLRLGLQKADGTFSVPSNPSEKIVRILQKPGENIYLFEGEESNLQNKLNDTNTSEVSFIVNEILGRSKDEVKNMGNSYMRFLQREKFKPEDKQHANIQKCEFEIKSVSMKQRSDFNDVGENIASTSTLHDDLLKLLEEDFVENK